VRSWDSLALLLAALNLWTFASFWHDKRQAIGGGWRVREGRLLLLSALGGSPAAFAARHLFRQKTRKQPFVTLLWLIALLQLGVLGVLGGWVWAGMPLPSTGGVPQGGA
jgi:uncharacterized membrane protein YsdA (DUF1294 family)